MGRTRARHPFNPTGRFLRKCSYQTNLMVYGPGGYRYVDYVKLGAPLDLAYLCVTVALAPFVFPF
jgi:di/tricarboxylate transporter